MIDAKLHCDSTDRDKQSYAFSQILIASDLVRQASASVYLSWEGRFNQPAKTQAAYNIDTLLPIN